MTGEYRQWIRDLLAQETGVRVFGSAVPDGEPTPEGTHIFTRFKPPVLGWDRGIVSYRNDVHLVVFFVRVTGTDEDDVNRVLDIVMPTLTGASPPGGGQISSVISQTWGQLDSKSRPQEYNEAASFSFPLNML